MSSIFTDGETKMRSKGLRIILPLLIGFLLLGTGCNAFRTSGSKDIEGDVAALKQQVAELEKQNRQLQQRLDDSGAITSEAVAVIPRLEQEIGVLQGRVDELGHAKQASPKQGSNILMRELGRQFATIDKRLTTLEKKAKVEDVDRGNLDVFTDTAAGNDEKKTDPNMFVKGEALFKQGNIEAAKAHFKTFLEENPDDEKASEAQFYLGECYFKQRAWEDAILSYDVVVNKYPESERVPTAILQMGIAFYESGEQESAELFFKRVIAKYPRSKEAAIARKKLEMMK